VVAQAPHVPPEHTGIWGEQSPFPAQHPSSTRPSQSLSIMSPHASALGVPGVHVLGMPFTQLGTVF
jgi:hypothetical protein